MFDPVHIRFILDIKKNIKVFFWEKKATQMFEILPNRSYKLNRQLSDISLYTLVFRYKGNIEHLNLNADYIIDNDFGDPTEIIETLYCEIYGDFVLIYINWSEFPALLIFNLLKEKFDYYVASSDIKVIKKNGQLIIYIASVFEDPREEPWFIDRYP